MRHPWSLKYRPVACIASVIGSDGRFREQELASQSGQIARARFAFLTPLAGPSPSDAERVVGIAFYLFPVVKALLH